VEGTLSSLKPRVAGTIAKEGIASGVILCHADPSLNITRQEGAGGVGAGGWNAVVSRAAQKRAPAAAPTEARVASGFVGLRKEPKKLVREETGEDWEAAAEKLDG
jgi:transcriptional repressor NF-X1